MFSNENILIKASKKSENTVYCSMLDNSLIILADGKIAACCWDYNFKVFDGPMGNANEELLLEVWNGEKFNKLINIMKQKGIIGKPLRIKCTNLYPYILNSSKFKPLISCDLVET